MFERAEELSDRSHGRLRQALRRWTAALVARLWPILNDLLQAFCRDAVFLIVSFNQGFL
jgi:hypothetical protein